jgi:hypothetical protein
MNNVRSLHKTATLVAVVFKSNAEFQVAAMIARIQPRKVVIFFQRSGDRLSEETVRSWRCLSLFGSELFVRELDFRGLTVRSFRDLALSYGTPSHIAVPLLVGAPFWVNVRFFRRFAEVINISDGSSENTSIRDSFFRLKFKWRKPYTILKTILLPALIRFVGRADTCYHPYAPLYGSCFSRESFPVSEPDADDPRYASIAALIKQAGAVCLLIGGFDFPAERLAEEFGVRCWVATSKNKELWVNGVRFALDINVCAEEVIELFQPKVVIGYASEAILAAKFRHPSARCFAILTPEIGKKWGSLHNWTYVKQARKLNISMVASGDLDQIRKQLREFSENTNE